MLKRIKNTNIGDIFSASINEYQKRHFQYIVSDLSQLNSDVIRVFKRIYSVGENPDISVIVKDEIDFYAHCITKSGLKKEMWSRVGNISDVGDVCNIYFKGKGDCSVMNNVQNDWYIYKVNNDKRKFIGKPTDELMKLDWDMIVRPEGILKKLQTGSYGGFYLFFDNQWQHK
jgi:hypothetical protein